MEERTKGDGGKFWQWTPPYNTYIIWPTQNPQTKHPLQPIISSIGGTVLKIARPIAETLTLIQSTQSVPQTS